MPCPLVFPPAQSAEFVLQSPSSLRLPRPLQFWATMTLPLPVGSALVLAGRGADVSKHCIPSVSAARVSITLRRIGETKRAACHAVAEAAPGSMQHGLLVASPVLPTARDPERRYAGPVLGFREPWLEKVERGEKTRDGRLSRDRIAKKLRRGDHLVGVSGQRHLLLVVTTDAMYHDSFGAAWAIHGDALVPPSIAVAGSAAEAQRLWEVTFNEGVPKAAEPRAVMVLGVECVRRLG